MQPCRCPQWEDNEDSWPPYVPGCNFAVLLLPCPHISYKCLHNLVITEIKELIYFKSKLLICFHLFQDS